MQQTNSARRTAIILGSVSLLLAPLLTFIGWAIAHESLAAFLDFNFTWTATDATAQLNAATSSSELIFRFFLLPHYIIYSSMPIYIGLSLCLAYVLFEKKPWHAFIGVVFSIIGAVYFIGVLAPFLSVPMGSTKMTTIIIVSGVLMMLLFVGNVIQGFGLYKSKIIPKWASSLFIFGNMLILIFPSIENWMALGSLFMIIGLLPLSMKLFHGNSSES